MDFLCIEFINSAWYITHKSYQDPIRNNHWLTELAKKWDIKSLPVPTEADMDKLIEMRAYFTELFKKIVSGQELNTDDILYINRHLSGVSFHKVLSVEKNFRSLCEQPLSRTWKWFMCEVAASFASLYSSEYIHDLKACQNPACGWLFIDESRQRNRKWCDETCASLMKVRKFRQKQRKQTL